MGLAAVLGLAFAVGVSVTVLPAILGAAYSRRRSRSVPLARSPVSLSGEGPGEADEG